MDRTSLIIALVYSSGKFRDGPLAPTTPIVPRTHGTFEASKKKPVSEQGSVRAYSSRAARLIESKPGLVPRIETARSRASTVPREHDPAIFYGDFSADDARAAVLSRNWFPANNYSLPGKQALSHDVGPREWLRGGQRESSVSEAGTLRSISTFRLATSIFPPYLA